jgi:hypothetical protein
LGHASIKYSVGYAKGVVEESEVLLERT